MKKEKTKPKTKTKLGPMSFRGQVVIYIVLFVGIVTGFQIHHIRKMRELNDDLRSYLEIDGTFADSDLILLEESATEPQTEPSTTEPATSEPVYEDLPAETDRPIDDAALDVYIPAGCVPRAYEYAKSNNGVLLQLDSEHKFSGSERKFGTFDGKNKSYRIRFDDLAIRPEVVEALNSMASAYETVTGRADLMVYSTVTPCTVAGSLYPDELADSSTGYCIDLSIRNEDGTIDRIRENSPWLTKNAHLYGFVRSYTSENREATGMPSAPYHLRYVGKVHACAMHDEGLTLDAYLDMLRKHSSADPYYWSDGYDTWTIYYVPAFHRVPVPVSGNFELSGDNTGGFFVTAPGVYEGKSE